MKAERKETRPWKERKRRAAAAVATARKQRRQNSGGGIDLTDLQTVGFGVRYFLMK